MVQVSPGFPFSQHLLSLLLRRTLVKAVSNLYYSLHTRALLTRGHLLWTDLSTVFLHKIKQLNEKHGQPKPSKQCLLTAKGARGMVIPKNHTLTPFCAQVRNAAGVQGLWEQENSRPSPGQSSDLGSRLQRQAQARQCWWWFEPFSAEYGNMGKMVQAATAKHIVLRLHKRLFPLSLLLYHVCRNEQQIYGKLSSVGLPFSPPSLFLRH